jgi:hypothetical protein
MLYYSVASSIIGPKFASSLCFQRFQQVTTVGVWGSEGGEQCKKDNNLSETENFEDQANKSIRKYSTYTVISLRHSQAEDMYLITRKQNYQLYFTSGITSMASSLQGPS